MTTVFDWLAVAVFSALAITYLSRSMRKPGFDDPVWRYAAIAVACALANWLGNEGHVVAAAATLAGAIVAYIVVIRPFRTH